MIRDLLTRRLRRRRPDPPKQAPMPDDASHLPYGWNVTLWVEENQHLQRQAADRIERALTSPAGLPSGYSLSEWVAHCQQEEQRYVARVAYWEQQQASAWAAHEAAWQQERETLEPPPPPPPPPPPFDPDGPSATIYRFFDADGGLLYIGQSIRAYERLQQHQRKEWFPQAANVTLTHVPLTQVLALEAEAIRAEHPRYNVIHRAGQP